jgi:hypothetical protein
MAVTVQADRRPVCMPACGNGVDQAVKIREKGRLNAFWDQVCLI